MSENYYTGLHDYIINYCRTSVQELVCHIRGVDIITFWQYRV